MAQSKKVAKASKKVAKAKQHPKIKQRRAQIEDATNRRRRQILATLGFVTALVMIGLAVISSPLFAVDRVVAAGFRHTHPEEVVAAADIPTGIQLTEVDTEGAIERVIDSSPWIESAKVERSWNGEVTVYVTELEAVLAVAVDAAGEQAAPRVLVGGSGKQLEEVQEIPDGVMLVDGLVANGKIGQPAPVQAVAAAAVARGLTDEIKQMTRSLEVSDGLIRAVLHDGSLINFGDANSMSEKVIAVETLFAQVDMRCLHEIDVRVPNAPTVTRKSRGGLEKAIVTDLQNCL